MCLTAAFFAGRLVSYTLYVGGASLARHSLHSTLTGAFRSPVGIALQVLMLAGLIALLRVDWAKLLAGRAPGDRREADHNDPHDRDSGPSPRESRPSRRPGQELHLGA